MNQLEKLQTSFQRRVLHPDEDATIAWVSAGGRAAPDIQLSVYSHAYRARLLEVLGNDYPASLLAMGEDHFERLAHDYIDAHPSRYFSLRDFGRHLPAFVGPWMEHREMQASMPWLRELTMFEWSLGQAFDVADVSLLGEADLAALEPHEWPTLRFVMHPSVQRLDLEWNVVDIWRALTAADPLPVTAEIGAATPWLIWRERLVTRFRSLERDEQQALDTLRAGETFNDACEALAALMNDDQVPMHAAGLLRSWIAQGLMCSIRSDKN